MEIINGTKLQAEQLLQKKSREEMKLKLLVDIRTDIIVCKLMGTDYKQYLFELKGIIDGFLIKEG